METNENEGKTTGVWNSTVVNNRSSLWLQKTNRTDAMFNHTGSCSTSLFESDCATLSEAQNVQKQEKIQLTVAWFIQTGWTYTTSHATIRKKTHSIWKTPVTMTLCTPAAVVLVALLIHSRARFNRLRAGKQQHSFHISTRWSQHAINTQSRTSTEAAEFSDRIRAQLLPKAGLIHIHLMRW